MLRLALAIAVAAVLVASASAACSNEAAHASALSYDFTLRANSPTISVATDTITITIDSVGANGRQMSTATIGLEGETATTGYTCHDFGIPGIPILDDRMTLSVSFTEFVSASTTPGATVTSSSDPSGFTEPGTWTEVDAYKTWVRTVELTFDEEMEVMRNSATIDVTRSITEEFLFFVSAPTQITFEDEDSIEIFDTPDFNILLTGYTVNFEAFDSSVSGTDTTYTVTMTTIIQQPFYISEFVLNSGTSHTAISPTLTDAEGDVTNTATAGSVTYNKQEWDFTFDLDTCGSADTFDFGVTVSCHSTQLGTDNCPIDDDTSATNNWDTATTTESITLPFSEFCSYEGAYAAPFTVDVTTWDEGDGGCAAVAPTNTDDFVTGDTVCFRGAVTTSSPDITVDTLTCDGVSNAQNGGGSDTATLSSVDTGSDDTCEYTVNQGTMNTDTSTVYTFDIQFTVTYVGDSGGAKRRSLLTTETTTASTTLQISANSNQAAGVGVGVGGVTGTSSGSSLGVVVGAIMGAAVLITLAVFVGVVIVLRKSPSDDRSRSNARYNVGGAPEVTPIVIQLNGGNNSAKKTKAAASRPMARVVPDESSAEADNMTSSTAAYSSAESSSAADYSSTAASTDYVSSSYV